MHKPTSRGLTVACRGKNTGRTWNSPASFSPLLASSSLRGRTCAREDSGHTSRTGPDTKDLPEREVFFISVKKGETNMAVTVERQPRDRATPWLETSGNQVLIDVLRSWGVSFFAGVNGGGVVHVAKHLEPYNDLSQSRDGVSRMLTMGEYVAGFAPLGHWYATGRIAGCVTTTGAATKLGGSGMTDAKLHNIPAIYLIALNSTMSIGNAPLQDVSEHGMNVVPQLEAELGDGCVVIDNINRLEDGLKQAQHMLKRSKPVAIAFHPDVLSRPTDATAPWTSKARTFAPRDVAEFVEEFPQVARGRRVIVYVSSEAAFVPGIQELTTRLSQLLRAPTVWSVNGANAVSPTNPWGYGY